MTRRETTCCVAVLMMVVSAIMTAVWKHSRDNRLEGIYLRVKRGGKYFTVVPCRLPLMP